MMYDKVKYNFVTPERTSKRESYPIPHGCPVTMVRMNQSAIFLSRSEKGAVTPRDVNALI